MIKFCSLYSGSSGNCIFIRSGDTRILIDAGLSGKRIIEALHSIGENPMDLSAVLVTHEHSDHTKGVGIVSRKFNVPVFANEKTWGAMEWMIGPVNQQNKMYFNTGAEFEIGPIAVKAFPIPHDAAEPVGYNFHIGEKKITLATDIGHITNSLLKDLEASDLLFLEANHDVEMLKVGPYPWSLKKRIMGEDGHLSNEMAGKVIAYFAEQGMRRFILAHLSKENNFPELAYQTVCNALTEKSICVGTDVSLEVAMRDRAGRIIEF
ncbi:MAG: metal-dependent hydrolase, beta-lactamase superfamily [Clostridiales bacterium]|jgi:phosphoribosyl 1,2-cyclic phosphodiesterase|nr:metal-dependent hydrolase, beta-lactamase superfamily [Clostridiales bacterium]